MLKQNLINLCSHFTVRKLIIVSLFLLPILLIVVVFFSEDGGQFAESGRTVYLSTANQQKCVPGSRSGEAGATYGESSLDGINFNVRAPLNYDPTIGHPLLMVYSQAGANRARTEKLTGLTYQATSAGFIVAYADHPNFSSTTTIQLGKIPGLIGQKWCIDPTRIYLTGHSDGGTVSMALAFMAGTRHIPTAIAPSAAGINYSDLSDRKCPDPVSVMVMHSAKDGLFRGFGKQSSGWWAACNECDPIPETLDNGCITYPNCAKGTKTWYCEGNKSHSKWPAINNTLIEFFTGL